LPVPILFSTVWSSPTLTQLLTLFAVLIHTYSMMRRWLASARRLAPLSISVVSVCHAHLLSSLTIAPRYALLALISRSMMRHFRHASVPIDSTRMTADFACLVWILGFGMKQTPNALNAQTIKFMTKSFKPAAVLKIRHTTTIKINAFPAILLINGTQFKVYA
jgi:hypothetical protein